MTNNEEFRVQEIRLRRQLLDMRFDLKLGKLLNTALIKKTKKDLARVLTLIRKNDG